MTAKKIAAARELLEAETPSKDVVGVPVATLYRYLPANSRTL